MESVDKLLMTKKIVVEHGDNIHHVIVSQNSKYFAVINSDEIEETTSATVYKIVYTEGLEKVGLRDTVDKHVLEGEVKLRREKEGKDLDAPILTT